MRKYIAIIFALAYGGLTAGYTQNISASEILKKSIHYHDPENKMARSACTFELIETRPNGSDRQSTVIMDPSKEYFLLERAMDEVKLKMIKKRDKTQFFMNGSNDISAADIEKYRLDDDRLVFMKNYYHYLWYLPMKLTDPGTILSPKVEKKDFFGKDALQIRVTYEGDVGSDIWYFYFHPENYSLVGYRFYHDEAANDGEYILLDGEVVRDGIKLPKTRKWYTHGDKRFLGSDELISLSLKN